MEDLTDYMFVEHQDRLDATDLMQEEPRDRQDDITSKVQLLRIDNYIGQPQ